MIEEPLPWAEREERIPPELLNLLRAIPALIRRRQRDPDPSIQGEAAQALGSLRATVAISALREIPYRNR